MTKDIKITLESEEWAFIDSEIERLKRECPDATDADVSVDSVVSTLVATGIAREEELRKVPQ